MKNKYQKALDNFWLAINCNAIPFDNVMGKDLLTLQELADKETPMKVTDVHVDEFYCPKCHCEITHDRSNSIHPQYCEECGQKLDWGE